MIRRDTLWFCRGFSLLMSLLLGGCSSVGYYGQLASGQLQLLRAREPVSQIIADPKTAPALRDHMIKAQQARAFASEHLHLPDNRSYRLYVDIGRPYVVWNVFATDEFSLDAISHCFPIAGCVAYRGYYDPGAARGEAALQRQAGKDVYLSGVETYSTLGWFDDPIISSMLHWGDERMAALIFHELAHQRFYVKDDSEFNESYANFVEQEGGRQWRAARGLAPEKQSDSQQRDQFTQLVLDARERLKTLYAQSLPATEMRARKAAEFERLRGDYRQMRDNQWAGDARYDPWINAPMNNAKLLPFGLYDQFVPAFAALYKQVKGDWPAFFNAVEKLGGLPEEQRRAALRQLMGT
jgi:predicted aminopeptidase